MFADTDTLVSGSVALGDFFVYVFAYSYFFPEYSKTHFRSGAVALCHVTMVSGKWMLLHAVVRK